MIKFMIMKKTLIFIIPAIIVIGILFTVSRKNFPAIPHNSDHRSITDAVRCMKCHGPDGEQSMKDAHPPKFECFKCHKPGKQGSD